MITTLEGFKVSSMPKYYMCTFSLRYVLQQNMNKLRHLDLTWNKLQNTREDVSIMRKHCPVLAVLDVRYNGWQKVRNWYY